MLSAAQATSGRGRVGLVLPPLGRAPGVNKHAAATGEESEGWGDSWRGWKNPMEGAGETPWLCGAARGREAAAAGRGVWSGSFCAALSRNRLRRLDR